MKTKLLNVNQVLIDKETYPRVGIDWVTLARYMGAMESGAVFPPICVAFLDGKYYLVDGRHRLEATKGRKQQHISVEVFNAKDKKEVYLEAVKRNISHGKQFSTQDVTNILITLEDWNLSKEQISAIVRIPADKIQGFVAKRVVLVTSQDGGLDKRFALRKPLSNIAGSVQDSGFETKQNSLIGTDQVHLLETVIRMIKNKWFDLSNDEVSSKFNILARLMAQTLGIEIENDKLSKSKKKGIKTKPNTKSST